MAQAKAVMTAKDEATGVARLAFCILTIRKIGPEGRGGLANMIN
jgi:hypothetical protein